MEDITRKFAIVDSKTEMREILSSVYNSLKVKGYDPINQLVGYILSEDPTYITNYNNARSLICRIDRDELMHELLTKFAIKYGAFPLRVTAILLLIIYTFVFMSVFWTFLVEWPFLPYIALIFTFCAVIM